MQNDSWHGTTILSVRKNGKAAIGADGQVSLGPTIIKASAKKLRILSQGKILAGFAGATADAFTLFERYTGVSKGRYSLKGNNLVMTGKQSSGWARNWEDSENANLSNINYFSWVGQKFYRQKYAQPKNLGMLFAKK